MFAAPWHGCPPFPLHSRVIVTCSGWFLYSSGRLSSNSCSNATCWASRATAILENKAYKYIHFCVCISRMHAVDHVDVYLACSCRILRSACIRSAAALESVRQAEGICSTGAFCWCSSGAGRGPGWLWRLDRMRSLAAHQSIHWILKK